MRPLVELGAERARRLTGLVFDLDGTLLTGGVLSAEAYRALWALRDSGLKLVVCTGRPAGWGEVLARQWPVELVVTENGAVAFRAAGGRLRRIDRLGATERKQRRERLDEIARRARQQFAELLPADDNAGRCSDVTFDIGEHQQVATDVIVAARRWAAEAGARSHLSSVHLHLTLDADDKASGTFYALAAALGEDCTAARERYAFVGDSGNDAACFAAFSLTFGVAGVRAHLAAMSVPPRFVSRAAAGAGFVEIATRLVALRSAA